MSPQSSRSLLRHRGFRALCFAQLLGAFNDNVFKMVVSLLAVDTAVSGHAGGYLSLVGAVFIAPYLLFSGFSGYVADAFDKRRVLVVAKAGEIAIMALALVALVLGRMEALLAALFLLAVQATFFSPAKYGILPEMLPASALPRANGMLELSRYVAVILGTVLGGLMLARWGDRPATIGLFLLAIAAVGFLASLRISTVPHLGAHKRFRVNPWSEIVSGARRLTADAGLMATVASLTYFEFLGTLVLLDIILVGKEAMGLDDAWTSLLGAFVGLGISLGSVSAGRASRGRVEIGLVPFAAIGVGLGIVGLSATTRSYSATACIMALVGFAGGFIIVPLNAALQSRAGGTERGHLISTNIFFNMTAVLLASGALWLLRDMLQLEPGRILLIAGLVTLAATIAAFRLPIYATSAAKWAWSTFGRAAPTALVAVIAFMTASAQAQDGKQTLVFEVDHQIFGHVGTAKIEIDRAGATTHVTTSIDIRVSVIGLTLHRMTGGWREVWENGQLASFTGAITTNGNAHWVQAVLDGSRVVVETPEGRVYVPRDIQPASPWSTNFIRAQTVMSPESGRLSKVEIVDLGQSALRLKGELMPARHYLVRGDAEQNLYFDQSGSPLKIVYADPSGGVTLVRTEMKSNIGIPVVAADHGRRP